MKDYSFQSFLGEGSYGIVFKVLDNVDKMSYAMKIITKNSENEINNLKELSHNHIISYKKAYKSEFHDILAIITELADTALSDKIKENTLKTPEIIRYFHQICLAVQYLHHKKPPMIHGDLKPQNILLKDDTIKLTDFGVSHIKKSENCGDYSQINEAFGTLVFLPPEILDSHYNQENVKFNDKMDIWALGIILYKMIFQDKHPFQGENMKEIVKNIRSGNQIVDYQKIEIKEFREVIISKFKGKITFF